MSGTTQGTTERRINQRRGNGMRVLRAHRDEGGTQGGRLIRQPYPRMVEEVGQEERARGEPPVNSSDRSVVTITLDETRDNVDETRGENLSADFVIVEDGQDGRDSRERSGNFHQEDVFDDYHGVDVFDDYHGVDVFDDYHGVPPVNPSQRPLPDELQSYYEIEEEAAIALETTIDLTNSPPRITLPLLSSPSEAPQIPPRFSLLSPQLSDNDSSRVAQLVPSSASLKCPLCLEPFVSIRIRGCNLVSTVCGHVFCGKCLPACVRISGHCPTCRMKVGYDDFHPLYLF